MVRGFLIFVPSQILTIQTQGSLEPLRVQCLHFHVWTGTGPRLHILKSYNVVGRLLHLFFLQTPAGVTLTCDLQYRLERGSLHWTCLGAAGGGVIQSVIQSPLCLHRAGVHRGFNAANRGVWNPVCLPHSGAHSAELMARGGGGNVFSLLQKNAPTLMFVCVGTKLL